MEQYAAVDEGLQTNFVESESQTQEDAAEDEENNEDDEPAIISPAMATSHAGDLLNFGLQTGDLRIVKTAQQMEADLTSHTIKTSKQKSIKDYFK